MKLTKRQKVVFVYLETYNYLYMKSLKQAATDYANQDRITRSEFGAFIDGIEFAQQWISVDEELPNDGILSTVLVKIKVKALCVDLGYMVSTYDKRTGKFSGLNKREIVTHWRQIELC